MPKAASAGSDHLQAHAPGHGKAAAPSLKRYQACHQCRRRKLKWCVKLGLPEVIPADAKRPCCSTCVRSHAYAVAHAVEGTVFPDKPECTYDEVPVFDADAGNSVSRKLYEKMENKIHELEALVREKDRALQSLSPQIGPSAAPIPAINNPLLNGRSDNQQQIYNRVHANAGKDIAQPAIGPSDSSMYGQYAGPSPASSNADYPQMPSTSALDSVNGVSSMINGSNGVGPSVGPSMGHQTSSPPIVSNPGPSPPLMDDFHVNVRSWPPNLPSPELTRHFVEAFFAYHMHASRMFHIPTFMASLELLPTDSRFPNPALLHMMCAVGSAYTAGNNASQVFDEPVDTPYELHQGRWRKSHYRPDIYGEANLPESFTEQQARFAKTRIEVGLVRGDFQCLQAQIILTWWYLSQGRWTDAFLSAAMAIRCTAPASISTCYTTAAITHYKPPSVLPPAKSVIEDEMRRNTFWIAYAMERQQGTGNGWSLSLDDQDVCQMMPLRVDQFDNGVLVLPKDRQWSFIPDLLYSHPPEQTDSFILYVKASILLSKVKTYNLRFRWQFTGTDGQPAFENPSVDVTNTAEFHHLDNLVASFRTSFPPRYRSPVEGDILDPYLYTACTAAHLAHILLHEPHAKPDSPSCPSAIKTLAASRHIVELMYLLGTTNYDVTLLDLQPFMCWFMAGRVLVRFLRAAIDNNRNEDVISLQREVSFVRSMLNKAGERVPLAYRYGKMLSDTLINMCGQQFAETMPETLPPRGYYMAVAASRPMVTNMPHTVEHIILS